MTSSERTDTNVRSDEAATPRTRSFRVLWVCAGIGISLVVVAAGGLLLSQTLVAHANSNGQLLTGPHEDDSDQSQIPVKTIRPRATTLVRSLELPGTIEPFAQAELYAKVPGYLKCIQRDETPPQSGARILDFLTINPGTLPWVAIAKHCNGIGPAQLGWVSSPQKDIGSVVHKGELLLEMDTPELWQDIAQKEALLLQAQAELEQARANLKTAESQVGAADALRVQAEADVRRWFSDLTYRTKQYERNRDLAKDKTIPREIADEVENQMNAAQSAWEGSKAKVKAAEAELAVVTSKFAAARVDIRVKEARVRIATEDVNRARILAEYSHVHALIEGVITSRNVDEGDFIQNSSTGQTRPVMTVAQVDRVLVIVNVPEREAPSVRIGTPMDLRVDSRPDSVIHGRVTRIGPALDTQTRTRRIEMELDNRNRELLPGMYGHVVLTLQRLENAQSIPATAVYSRGGQNMVLQITGGVVHRHRVRIRYDDGKVLEVAKLIDGKEMPLDGTEELIVSNKGEIADGQHVRTASPTP